MAIGDRLKDLRSKAEEAVVERKDQINQAVQKAGEVADQRTGGKYHEQIQRAGGKAAGMIESLEGGGATGAAEPRSAPAASQAADASPDGGSPPRAGA